MAMTQEEKVELAKKLMLAIQHNEQYSPSSSAYVLSINKAEAEYLLGVIIG